MPDAPAAGGGGGAGVPPALAPCTPEKFDEFWEAVEALELVHNQNTRCDS